jgi:hypothetical protein
MTSKLRSFRHPTYFTIGDAYFRDAPRCVLRYSAFLMWSHLLRTLGFSQRACTPNSRYRAQAKLLLS